jgi:hypothetical protein
LELEVNILDEQVRRDQNRPGSALDPCGIITNAKEHTATGWRGATDPFDKCEFT